MGKADKTEKLVQKATALLNKKRFEKALQILEKAAELGNSTAMYNIGLIYEKGNGVQQNSAQAAHWYEKSAELGHPVSQYKIAVYKLNKSEDDEEQLATAAKWFKLSAEQKNANAQHFLGYCYSRGLGVPQDDEKAMYWSERAVINGSAAAHTSVGYYYVNGIGAKQDIHRGISYLEKAVSLGESEAARFLCEVYMQDCYTNPPDFDEAKYWLEKAVEMGNDDTSETERQLRELREKHKSENLKRLSTAAENGDADAQYGLAVCIIDEDNENRESYEKASVWLDKAAAQGHDKAAACLGELLFDGTYLNRDTAKAKRLLEAAKRSGDTRILYMLGELEEDPAQKLLRMMQAKLGGNENAKRWLERHFEENAAAPYGGDDITIEEKTVIEAFEKETGTAAKKDNTALHMELARRFREGDGVQKGSSRAFGWYAEAAARGDSEAMLALGDMYADGEGVSQDAFDAVFWYDAVANSYSDEVDDALCRAGEVYLHGKGTERDLKRACDYFNMAINNENYILGLPKAYFNLALLLLGDEYEEHDDALALEYMGIAYYGGIKEALPYIKDYERRGVIKSYAKAPLEECRSFFEGFDDRKFPFSYEQSTYKGGIIIWVLDVIEVNGILHPITKSNSTWFTDRPNRIVALLFKNNKPFFNNDAGGQPFERLGHDDNNLWIPVSGIYMALAGIERDED